MILPDLSGITARIHWETCITFLPHCSHGSSLFSLFSSCRWCLMRSDSIKYQLFPDSIHKFLVSADNSLILPKSPAFTRSPFTIQLPPQQRILSQERYSVKFPALIPPVGINLSPTYGAAIALIMAIPPACSAGKNFTMVRPLLTACATSEGEMQPGRTGIFFSRQ